MYPRSQQSVKSYPHLVCHRWKFGCGRSNAMGQWSRRNWGGLWSCSLCCGVADP